MAAVSLSERSAYYRSLLVLSRRDRVIDDREREFMLRIGRILGFDRRFCEDTMDELLSNPCITRDPVVFSDRTIRECFFRDAIRVASSDGFIHPMERRWLKKMALANGKPKQWVDAALKESSENRQEQDHAFPLEIEKYL